MPPTLILAAIAGTTVIGGLSGLSAGVRAARTPQCSVHGE
jgi:hypothetical protein